MTAPKAKRCPRCGQVKPLGAFYRRRGGACSSPFCQPCQRATSREQQRRRQDPAEAERLRAVDRTRQRRRRALRRQPPPGGDAA